MEIGTEVIKILDDVGKKFGVAIDWTSKNINPYLMDLYSRIIKYEIATSIIWIVLGILALVLSIKMIQIALESETDEVLIIFGLVALASILIIGYQCFDIIGAITIPEKVVIEFIKDNIIPTKQE